MTSFLIFDSTQPFDDARIAELRLLSDVARNGGLSFGKVAPGGWRDLLIAAISDGLLTAFTYETARQQLAHEKLPIRLATTSGIPGESPLERAIVSANLLATENLLDGTGGVVLYITHQGRVRVSELKHLLRSNREREPLGILWDVRHWERDLQIALIDASPASPVAVAYLDMNGLKELNDTAGHGAGNDGLRSYFQAVTVALGDAGQAYRLSGDEVLAVLPAHDGASAAAKIETAGRLLMKEPIATPKGLVTLSVSAGVVAVTDPASSPSGVSSRADHEQYRAKEKSREAVPRPTVIAIEHVGQLKVICPATV